MPATHPAFKSLPGPHAGPPFPACRPASTSRHLVASAFDVLLLLSKERGSSCIANSFLKVDVLLACLGFRIFRALPTFKVCAFATCYLFALLGSGP